jgi:hypothetical protein
MESAGTCIKRIKSSLSILSTPPTQPTHSFANEFQLKITPQYHINTGVPNPTHIMPKEQLQYSWGEDDSLANLDIPETDLDNPEPIPERPSRPYLTKKESGKDHLQPTSSPSYLKGPDYGLSLRPSLQPLRRPLMYRNIVRRRVEPQPRRPGPSVFDLARREDLYPRRQGPSVLDIVRPSPNTPLVQVPQAWDQELRLAGGCYGTLGWCETHGQRKLMCAMRLGLL